jgi:hypothetical protein
MDGIDDEVAHNGEPPKDTPPTEPAKETPAVVVEPPAKPEDNGDLREAVNGLTETVTSLVTTVSTLVAGKDSTPVKKPWTHWGSK